MPKSMVNVVPINLGECLVDAKVIAAHVGFTPQYINRMAAVGKIPWHGIRNGATVYRRFRLAEVMAALSHSVEDSAPETLKTVERVNVKRSAKAG